MMATDMEIGQSGKLDDIRDALSRLNCYTEVRLERRYEARVDVTGTAPTIETRREWGGYVRALLGDMWRFDSFAGSASALGRLRQLRAYSQTLTHHTWSPPGESGAYSQEPVCFQQHSIAELVNIQEIRDLLTDSVSAANDLPRIRQVHVCLVYQLVRATFLNSEGSLIQQEKPCCDVLATYVVMGRTLLPCIFRFNCAGVPQYSQLTDWIYECTTKATCLSAARPVKPGRYTVLLHPSATGALLHEIVGHLREADNIANGLVERPDEPVGIEALNIVDDGTLTQLPGGYYYDDEGRPSTRAYLVKGGRLTGRLHSRQTACRWCEAPTGSARTASYRYPPLPRMSCTFVEPASARNGCLIDHVEEGLYLRGMRNGTASGSSYAFTPEEAFKIEYGRITEPVSEVVMTGDIWAMLRSIKAVGSDFGWARGAGCAKSGQYLPTISWGGPHIILTNALIGEG